MANSLFVPSLYPALQLNGDIAALSTWTFYDSGTTTLADIYDADDAPLTNPLLSDAYGRFVPVYLDNTVAYRALLKNALGVTLAGVDPYNAAVPTGGDVTVAGDLLFSVPYPQIIFNPGGPRIVVSAANTVYFGPNGVDQSMEISPTGVVNFNGQRGTTGDVLGSANISAIASYAGGFAWGSYDTLPYTPQQFVIDVAGISTQVGSITCDTTTTTYNTTSDQTLKDDDGLLSPEKAWAIVQLIAIHEHRWKSNGKKDINAFAQELFEVYPSAVERGFWHDKAGRESDQPFEGATYIPWGVDYSRLVPLLIPVLQDLVAKVERLEAAQ